MQLKMVVGILSAVLLCLLSTTALIKSKNGKIAIQAQESVNKPKIKVTQLFSETGALPVELESIPEAAQAQDLTNASQEGSSPKIHFKIKNTSLKGIDAYQVHIHLIALEDDGDRPTVEVVQDFAPHPDIRDYYQYRSIPPGGEKSVGPRGVKLKDGKKLQTVVLKMDFVVYEDGTFVSSAQDGAESVLGRRRGAAKFKQWAVKFYNENNKSADKLYERLLVFKPYKDMVFESEGDIRAYESAGANVYRDFLIMLYNKDRLATEKYLNEVK